ncbi:MAG: hypothetical protein ACE5IP_07700 [Terriglobia bacterium]
MRTLHPKAALAILLSLGLLSPGPALGRDFFLQEGTEVPLRLRTSVDTKISQKGDRIIATVEEPVLIDNVEVIPVGARVLGRIGDIKKPGRFGRGGQLVLTFDLIEVPGSGNIQISGSLVDLYDPDYEEERIKQLKNLDLGEEGQVKGSAPGKLKRGGSLLGATGAGAATGGAAGALIGAAVGAGVGFIWFKGKHVELPAGIGMVMRVDRGVTLSVPDMPRPAGSQ